MKRERGFTLIELLIVTAIMGVALAVTSDMFLGLLNQYKQQSKLAETNIEGIIGLELLRQDIERAGYGLPWVIPAGLTYSGEATPPYAQACNELAPGGTSDPPRPMVTVNNIGFVDQPSQTLMHIGQADYLAIKAVNIPGSGSSQLWSYLTTSVTKSWDQPTENLAPTDYVIVLSPGTTSASLKTLALGSSSQWYSTFQNLASNGFVPAQLSPQPLFVYGLGTTAAPQMPFNRADYYVQGQPSSLVPSRCAPNTGVLVKSVVSQSDGSMGNPLPLFDCVADLKVIFRLDRNGDGNLTPTDVLNDLSGNPLTAQQIRTQVKEVRIYVLAQEGQMDNSFTYPSPTITVGEFGLGHTFTVGANVHYRWKVYTIVMSPKNMRQS
jgi:prepilin-type N-terminal cleavage/methylation domain-containing protein